MLGARKHRSLGASALGAGFAGALSSGHKEAKTRLREACSQRSNVKAVVLAKLLQISYRIEWHCNQGYLLSLMQSCYLLTQAVSVVRLR